jgi:phosphatidylinositol alpha-1,6-mannosyltransferase
MDSEESKPRVLVVSRKWPPAIGGMETYSVELVDGLRSQYEVDALVLPGRTDGRAPGLMGYACFVLKAMAYCILKGRKVNRVIFTDLILLPAAICHWLIARRAQRLVIVYGLDLVYHKRPGLLPLLYRAYFGFFRKCQGVFSSIVAISRYTASLAHDAGLLHISIVNPVLPVDGLPDAYEPPEQMPDVWQEAARRVLYFGRLVPRKGAAWYAEEIMPGLSQGTTFFVVGDSSDQAYKARIARCVRTVLLGRMDKLRLAEMIRTADLVVMPNIHTPLGLDVEGFGLAAIEASALGGRLLASRIDGITDAVVDGVTGTLLEPQNSGVWSRATVEALESPIAAEQRARIAQRTRKLYSRANQISAFARLLEPPRTRS